jgi:hypothetical protein
MGFGICNVRYLYRAGSLIKVSKEQLQYKLHIVYSGSAGGQMEGQPAGECTFLYGKGNEDHELGTGFILLKTIISAVKKVECVCDRKSYMRSLCHIVVLNVHPSTEDKIDEVKDSF